MRIPRNAAVFLAALTVGWFVSCAPSPAPPAALSGVVTSSDGSPASRAIVTLRADSGTMAFSAVADDAGRYRFETLEPGEYGVTAQGSDAVTTAPVSAVIPAEPGTVLDITVEAGLSAWDAAQSPAFLALLPNGEEKRKFILDCTGCHHFSQRTVGFEDRLKTREEWTEWVQVMMANNAFMSPSREVGETVDWVSGHLEEAAAGAPRPEMQRVPRLSSEAASRASYTEYDIPVPEDLPHDLMVDVDGRIVVTGQLTGVMFVLDPVTGAWEDIAIPVEGFANPRAIDIDHEGNWMVALGAPQSLARRTRATGEWDIHYVDMHPHSVQFDAEGDLWYNGHFSIDPERIGWWDGDTGEANPIVVPSEAMPDGGITMQYGLRVAPDGTVWTTQLHGGRLIRYDPPTGEFTLYDMPVSASGPRRPDVGSDGRVWIPEYAGGQLTVFDPSTEEFRRFQLPIQDALPYVVRVDPRRNVVWIGTSAAETVFRFDPSTETFEAFPLPTRGALIRHMDIDEESGDLWAAYGAFPSRGVNRILRIRTE
jgi:virginiamycin B lyase